MPENSERLRQLTEDLRKIVGKKYIRGSQDLLEEIGEDCMKLSSDPYDLDIYEDLLFKDVGLSNKENKENKPILGLLNRLTHDLNENRDENQGIPVDDLTTKINEIKQVVKEMSKEHTPTNFSRP